MGDVKNAWAYILRLYDKYNKDAGPLFGAAIAYATLFSLFPLLLLSISIVGYLIASPERQAEVIQAAVTTLPVGLGDSIRDNVSGVVSGRGISGVIAAIGLIIGAIGVFGSLEVTLNRVLGAERPRGPIKSIALHLLMVLILFILAVLSTLVGSAQGLISTFTGQFSNDTASIIYNVVAQLTALVLSASLYVVVLLFIPNVKLRLREVLPIALGAAIIWETAKYLFGLYLQSLAKYSVVYGSVGAVIALLTWLYISASILILAAEIISMRRGVGEPVPVVKTEEA